MDIAFLLASEAEGHLFLTLNLNFQGDLFSEILCTYYPDQMCSGGFSVSVSCLVLCSLSSDTTKQCPEQGRGRLEKEVIQHPRLLQYFLAGGIIWGKDKRLWNI